MYRTVLASVGLTTSRRSRASYPSGGTPPIHIPLRLEAAILSRMRSPVTSRSNCAKDSSTLRVRRPIEVVVLKCVALHRRAGKASIIISSLDEPPALARLALDERLTRLALRVQRIEVLLKAFFGRLPRIDCAASCSRFSVLHRGSPHAIA